MTPTGALRVVIWHPHQFVREALADVVRRQSYVRSAVAVPTAEAMTELCEEQKATTCLVDLDAAGDEQWAAFEDLVVSRSVRVIGLTSRLDAARARRAYEAGVRAIVEDEKGLDAVLAELRPSGWRSTAFRERDTRDRSLDDFERDVLRLIASGLTARAIVAALGVSASRVDAAKRRAFAKLGVQQQAHAVAVALREGLLDDRGPASDGVQ